jgi:thiamine-monophosphate kinase
MRPAVLEESFVATLVRGLARSPLQVNDVHESDAELVRLPDDGLLAVTVDQIVEEIRAGLYDDPFLLGWMTVVASASDLAAVGADPLGLVVGQTFAHDPDPAFVTSLQRGLAEASAATGLPVLGGDTAFDDRTRTASTALGLVPDGRVLTRRGARPGDRLVATGHLGLGSAFAWARLAGRPGPVFRPCPHPAAGRIARNHATAAADTSDGFLPACDLLLRWGGLDLEVTADPADLLHPVAARLAADLAVPPWTVLAGPHGEYELLLAVPSAHVAALEAAYAAKSVPVRELGVFRAGTGRVSLPGSDASIDPARIRNLHPLAAEDPDRFLRALLEDAVPAGDGGGDDHASR